LGMPASTPGRHTMGFTRFIPRFSSARSDWCISSLLVLLTCALYLVFRSAQQSGDYLSYAYAIRTGKALFHPHHVLFSPVVRGLYLTALQFNLSFDAVFVGQLHNILWAAVAIVALYHTLRVILSSRARALTAAIVFFASIGVWSGSTQAEVYVPATACLSLAALLLVSGYGRRWSATRLLSLSVLYALAVLYHQSNVIFALPLAAALLNGDATRKIGKTTAVLCLSGVLVLIVYVLAYTSAASQATVEGFFRFCLAYTDHPNPAWGTTAHFSPAGVALLLKSQLRSVVYVPPGSSWPVLAAIAVFGLLLAGVVVHAVGRVWRVRTYRGFRISLIAWLLSYYFFFLWWLPGRSEFFVMTLPPLLMLTSMTLKDLSGHVGRSWLRRVLLAATAGALLIAFVINIAYSVLPQTRSRGPSYAAASQLAAIADDDCTVVCEYKQMQHLRYCFGRERVVESSLILLYAYHRGAVPDTLRLDADRCALIPLSVVVPDYRGVGTSGYDDRSGWRVFITWLFDVREGTEASEMTLRDFELLRDGNGTEYILLSARRIGVDGWAGLLANLDEKLAIQTGIKSDTFSKWLR